MSVIVSFAPGPEGEAALAEGAVQASGRGAPLTVICTVPTPEAREAAEAAVNEYDSATLVHVEEGNDAVETIIDEIEKANSSLLVLGLRRRTPVGKLILGSSAQRLLLDAPCPVLAVKPDSH